MAQTGDLAHRPPPTPGGVAMFYQLLHGGLVETARMILARAQAQGWRAHLRCPDDRLARQIDEALWLPDDSFLPHGLARGGPEDARQPLLIGPGAAMNGARGLMLVAQAQVTAADLAGLERLWVLFDGQDAAALALARAQWAWTGTQGLAAQYWADEGGAWAMKTERAAAAGEVTG